MKLTLTPFELRDLLRAGAIVPDRPAPAGRLETWGTDLNDDPRVALEEQVASLSSKAYALQQEVDLLEARAKAATPVVEAQAVIDKAVELWRTVDAASRALTLELNRDAAGDVAAKREAELLRAIRVLGDALGEEGGEDLDPPC